MTRRPFILMEVEHRIILELLVNEGFDTNQILEKLQTHSEERVYALPAVRFWIGRVAEDVKTFMASIAPEDDHSIT
jgi:hypothetical protein